MLCDKCNKNEATVHFTEIINGTRSEHHLCNECMHEMDHGVDAEFPLSKLIRGILSAHLAGIEQGAASSMQLACDKCGMTYEDFMKIGKFGCAECYSVFGPLIVDNVRKLQGSSKHSGKRYTAFQESNEIDFLGNDIGNTVVKGKSKKNAENSVEVMQRQLKKALEIEDYEEAARLRDAIKLEKERVGKNA